MIVLGGAAGIVTAVLAARRYHSKRPQVLHLTLVGFGAVNRALARLVAKEKKLARLQKYNDVLLAKVSVSCVSVCVCVCVWMWVGGCACGCARVCACACVCARALSSAR